MDTTQAMLDEAIRAREKAYAPYSRFRVGAAVATAGGRIFSGCNVENASLGLTLCAERSAIARMVETGERKIEAILIIGDSPHFLPPCGGCRQVIAEFADANTRVILCRSDGQRKVKLFSELFPEPFSLKC